MLRNPFLSACPLSPMDLLHEWQDFASFLLYPRCSHQDSGNIQEPVLFQLFLHGRGLRSPIRRALTCLCTAAKPRFLPGSQCCKCLGQQPDLQLQHPPAEWCPTVRCGLAIALDPVTGNPFSRCLGTAVERLHGAPATHAINTFSSAPMVASCDSVIVAWLGEATLPNSCRTLEKCASSTCPVIQLRAYHLPLVMWQLSACPQLLPACLTSQGHAGPLSLPFLLSPCTHLFGLWHASMIGLPRLQLRLLLTAQLLACTLASVRFHTFFANLLGVAPACHTL